MKTKNKDEIIITEEKITKFSIDALKLEKQELKDQLDMPKPSNEELIEFGKLYHPFYTEKERIKNRIDEINELLN